ncbi:glycoside hydrolase family protein [Paracoccus aestuariivivens]|uniref:Lysozyme n=1 Tax=Paracoccus aestuariivivens TaxID=1820333 RepID=A0A6L6JFA2_9RHOB|nr:peptidoglycan-binding protein [Paracoccus aestuariivivens]MTH79409.1 glycoside hydrolase family protein [Paracoccus aestuariivivens]
MVGIISRSRRMTTSPAGITALISHEGIVPAPYLDSVGVWTWGVGHTSAAGAPHPASMPRGMPVDLDAALDEVFTVFAADLASYEEDVRQAVQVMVSQHEFDALVSFHYNTGAIARATVTKLLNAGDITGAAAAFMNWRTPAAVKERREAEQLLFRKGIYPTGKLTVWSVDGAGKITWRVAKTLTQAEALACMDAYLLDQPVAQEAPEDSGVLETDWASGLPILAKGSKGPEVRQLQVLLVAKGHVISVDGDFGNRTRASVKLEQTAHGLWADGVVGPKTWPILKGI